MEADILAAIPDIGLTRVREVVEVVIEIAETTHDLTELEVEDLKCVLKKLTAKRLISFWKKKYHAKPEGE